MIMSVVIARVRVSLVYCISNWQIIIYQSDWSDTRDNVKRRNQPSEIYEKWAETQIAKFKKQAKL
jgi:5-methylcytosine-specific restriction endonuclease McrA